MGRRGDAGFMRIFGNWLVLPGTKLQGGGVHTVPLTCRSWSVVKDVAEVGIAPTAFDLDSMHTMAQIRFRCKLFSGYGCRKARPAAAGVKLGFREVERLAAAHTQIDARRSVVMILA